MGRKNGAKNEETVRIRMSTDLLSRILAAKDPAGWSEEADSSFVRHLIVLGITKVERDIKAEQARNEYQPESEAQDHLAGLTDVSTQSR
jgi:hypothetical protein